MTNHITIVNNSKPLLSMAKLNSTPLIQDPLEAPPRSDRAFTANLRPESPVSDHHTRGQINRRHLKSIKMLSGDYKELSPGLRRPSPLVPGKGFKHPLFEEEDDDAHELV